jgi:hypothetical protein
MLQRLGKFGFCGQVVVLRGILMLKHQKSNILNLWVCMKSLGAISFIRICTENASILRALDKQSTHGKNAMLYIALLGPCHTRHFCTQYCDKKDIVIFDNFEK